MPTYYSQIVDHLVALARASAVTSTLKLGTGVCLVQERNPILLAKEVASLDYFSGGRFLFGVGIGWLREEIEIFVKFEDRVRYTQESILAMKEIWTKEESQFHGKLIDFSPIKSFPKPVHKPHPPIYLGGDAKNVFHRVMALGDGWMPIRVTPARVREGRRELDRLAEESGRDPSTLEVTVFGLGPDSVLIKEFEDAGASRVICRANTAPEAQAVAELRQIASKVLV